MPNKKTKNNEETIDVRVTYMLDMLNKSKEKEAKKQKGIYASMKNLEIERH